MPPRKGANKNFVQNAISTHSMNLRSKSLVCSNGNIDRLGFDTKLSENSHSMTLRTRKRRPNVVATSKAITKIGRVVKKHQHRLNRESAQIEISVGPQQPISIRNKTFDDLTDDCVYLIFGKFGIQELMLLRTISTRCLSIIEKIFLGIKSLKLFVGHFSVQEYFLSAKLLTLEDDEFRLKPNEHAKNDDLVFNHRKITNLLSQTNYEHVNPNTFLPRLFPNVCKLFICLSKDYQVTFFDYAFDCFRGEISYFENRYFDFSPLLHEFSHLSTLFLMNPPSYWTNPLWHNIASKVSLRSLYLVSIKSAFRIPDNIYHNLQQWTIVTDDKYGVDFVLPYLEPNCTQLAFYWRSFESEQLRVGLNLNRNNLKNTITHFSIGPQSICFGRKDLLLSTCVQMKSLTYLKVSLDSQEIKLKDIFAQLASLSRLAELRLFDLNKHLETDESEASSSFRPLPSITNLSLGISFGNTNDKILNVGHLQDIFTKVFPSLIKATILCKDQTILNQSRECFSNTRFPHLRQSSFYADLDGMFEPSKYLGRHIPQYKPGSSLFY